MMRSPFGHRLTKTTSGTGIAFYVNTFQGLFVDYASTANIADLAACSTTLDGATLAEGKTVMLKDQTVTAQNGFYYVDSVSGSTCVLLRLPGFEAGVVLPPGFQVRIGNGSANANLTSRLTGTGTKVIGTDSVSFDAVTSTIEGDSLATRISTSDSGQTSADTSMVSRLSTVDSGLTSADASLGTRDSTSASVAVSADTSVVSRLSTVDSGLTSADASLTTRDSTITSITTSLQTRISIAESVEASKG